MQPLALSPSVLKKLCDKNFWFSGVSRACSASLMSVWIASMRDSENWKWLIKAWFSYVGKIPHDRGFYFLPIVSDISDNHHNSVSNSTNEFGQKWKVRKKLKLAWWEYWSPPIWGIGNERNPSPTSPTIQTWVFICPAWSPTIAEIWDASGK